MTHKQYEPDVTCVNAVMIKINPAVLRNAIAMKISTKCTGKQLCPSLFLDKVAGFRTTILLKGSSNIVLFL